MVVRFLYVGGLMVVRFLYVGRADGYEVSVCWRACDGFVQEGW
jgi:hypothetical protein